jgi:hypothetical protein
MVNGSMEKETYLIDDYDSRRSSCSINPPTSLVQALQCRNGRRISPAPIPSANRLFKVRLTAKLGAIALVSTLSVPPPFCAI